MASKLSNYIERFLIPEIISNLNNEQLVTFKAENVQNLDGFMSSMYAITLKTETTKGFKERNLMAKFMRGDEAFRESSKAGIQFANEIYVYNKILPQYAQMLKELNISTVDVMQLVPYIYMAKFGYIEGLSSLTTENCAALVMDNLKPLGYQLASSMTLNRDHLLAMSKSLGQFHAYSYALKVLDNSKFESLIEGIITLPFIDNKNPQDATNNTYRALHRCGFDRFYKFYDRFIETDIFDKNSQEDLKLIKCLNKMRETYFETPSNLPEKLRTKINDNEDDKKFAVILHGDYYRNNVLFKYKQLNKKEFYVENLKMFDFQQLRFGSPAFDLSFFMFLNTAEDERPDICQELLKAYHSQMIFTFHTILSASKKTQQEISNILNEYNFEKFQLHFARFAFYGPMICLHFLPWIMCSKEECKQFSELFAHDVFGSEFHKVSVEAGGDEVTLKILSVLRHACKLGYMDNL